MLKPNIGAKSLIIMLLVCIFISSGCQQKPTPTHQENINVGTNNEAIENKEEEQLRAVYWLGDAGEKAVEYRLQKNQAELLDLLTIQGENVLTGFADYDLMLNLIFAQKKGLWGLYDQTGKMIYDHVFSEISNYEMPDGYKPEGLVGVKKDGLWGAIDQQGKMIIEPNYEDIDLNQYEEVEPFIRVKKDGKYGYLTKKGQPLVDTIWDNAFMDVLNEPEDIIFIRQGEKWGGIRVENNQATAVDWKLIPREEARLGFNNWQYYGQYDFYLQQVQNKSEEITDNTKIFFNNYFKDRRMELWLLPSFAKDTTPNWDDLTLFILCNTFDQWQDGYISKDYFAETVKKYFGDIEYTHKSSAYLTYQDGKYTPSGLSYHGSYIYELTNLKRGQSIDGKDSWEAWLTGYYFRETDGEPNGPGLSENAKAVYAEMKKDDYYGPPNFYEACDRMVLRNPKSVLQPAAEWQIEFRVNDSLGEIYFTYLSCEKKEYPMP